MLTGWRINYRFDCCILAKEKKRKGRKTDGSLAPKRWLLFAVAGLLLCRHTVCAAHTHRAIEQQRDPIVTTVRYFFSTLFFFDYNLCVDDADRTNECIRARACVCMCSAWVCVCGGLEINVFSNHINFPTIFFCSFFFRLFSSFVSFLYFICNFYHNTKHSNKP